MNFSPWKVRNNNFVALRGKKRFVCGVATLFHRQCPICKNDFSNRRAGAKFCGASCYGKSQRRWNHGESPWVKCAQCLRDVGLTAKQAGSILLVRKEKISSNTNRPKGILAKSVVLKAAAMERARQANRALRDQLFADTGYRTTEQERIREKQTRPANKKQQSPEKRRQRRQEWLSNPANRLRASLGRRLYKAMKFRGKSPQVEALVGCSFLDLKDWIESQFRYGMTWGNYGFGWHVDHIQPCASFDHSNPDHVRRCWHFTNLRPMWASENIAKGDQITEPQMQLGV
jgi:hypothetical protein